MNDDEKLDNNEELDQENFLLKSKLMLKGGMLGMEGNLPSEIENMFLKNVMAFEEAEYKPICEILGIDKNDFPPVELLSKKEIEKYLIDLENIMGKHNMFIELQEDLPIEIAYKYLIEEYLLDEVQDIPGFSMIIDGCGGDCPSCFQLAYCNMKDDTWPPDELAAAIIKRKRLGED